MTKLLISILLNTIFTFVQSDVVTPSTAAPHHDHHHKFGDKDEVMDEEHIKLHFNHTIDIDKKMDNDHSQFYYFDMHNLNKDLYIDGLEVAKGLTHSHDGEPFAPITDEEIETMVDAVLKDFDKDGNGLISYGEYKASLSVNKK
ncbi:unnamed protein product [Bursaphelenchus okinawaensis]|uniref:EF-hand domain-containing protein n=1 Tax=Bursaphelenchus okinawaensis TaxID=465554 RepID=A0A811L9A8_9BILA|nr:unnamed protein product [Bursaphelenchus okinawaensis]CAG9119030.1 unnamed protein product [Bursaphelenchus okinawaensis]